MLTLDLNHDTLAFQEELGSLIRVLCVKDLVKTTLFTDDEVRCFLATLIPTVKVASCLLIEDSLKDLSKSYQELGLTSIRSSVN